MSSNQTLLLDARSLIQRGWTQHTDARSADGQPVQPWNPAATAWSLLGALVAALETQALHDEPHAISELAAACTALATVIDNDSLTTWNDQPTLTQHDVLHALNQAAAEQGAEPRPGLNGANY